MEKDKKMSIDDLNALISAVPQEEVERIIKKNIEDHSPNKDGSCKQANCTGFVVKCVSGLSSLGYHYGLPKCSVCGHQYIFTNDINIPIVGMKEFQEMMNTPFTI